MERPGVERLLEFGIYVEDVERSAAFYERVLGLKRLLSDRRLVALDVNETGVLLIFQHGASTEPIDTPYGVLPPHDGNGRTHFAFAVREGELERWEAWLGAEGVAIESTMDWGRGGRSLYFRDPDGHLLELVTPGTWATY